MNRTLDRPAMVRVLTVPVALVAAAALVTACSSSKSSGSKSTGGAGSTTSAGAGAVAGNTQIEVKNFSFSPDAVTVKVGSTVTWKFDDDTAHTVKADDGSFKSDALSGGKTFSFTFNKAGQYSYICSIHPQMKAAITVQ